MTVPPYLAELISRERQHDMMARADRQRRLGGLARAARRGRGTGRRPRRARRGTLWPARLRPGPRAARDRAPAAAGGRRA